MGRAWKFGENVNTDEIIPARYNITIKEKELAENVFCEVRPEFPEKVEKGDFVVAGENFGCGSSREHAPIAIKGAGIKCVIAKSYARIFFRNSINIGLPILECSETENIDDGDELEVNLKESTIENLTKNKVYKAEPLPDFVLEIVNNGGIVNYLKEHDIEELQ